MYVFAKIVLVILAVVAFFEGIGAFSQAQSIMHQIYAGTWCVVFAVSLGSAGIISAMTREVEVMAELKTFLQRIKNRATTKQSSSESGKNDQTIAKTASVKPTPRVGQEAQASRQCPYCGEDVSVDAKGCPVCTRILNPYIPCPKCKADISHKPSECPECGSKITWRNASDSTK